MTGLPSRAATLANVWAVRSWRWKTYIEMYTLIQGAKRPLLSKLGVTRLKGNLRQEKKELIEGYWLQQKMDLTQRNI